MGKKATNSADSHKTIISYIALVVAFLSLFVSIRSCRINETTKHLHVRPQIETSYLQSKKADYIVFRNISPIEIISLSVNYKTYGFDKEQGKYRTVMAGGKNLIDELGRNWIFKEKLAPNEKVSEFLGEMSSGSESTQQKFIVVRVFDIIYYHPSDMSKFEKREVFFIDGGKIFTYNEARKNEALQKPVQELDGYIQKMLNYPFRLGDVEVKKNN